MRKGWFPRKLLTALNLFDEAAQDWGYQSDQGSEGEAEKSRAVYDAARAGLIDAIQAALEGPPKKIKRAKKKGGGS